MLYSRKLSDWEREILAQFADSGDNDAITEVLDRVVNRALLELKLEQMEKRETKLRRELGRRLKEGE